MSTVTPEVIERVETALRFATDRKYLATAIDLGDIRALLGAARERLLSEPPERLQWSICRRAADVLVGHCIRAIDRRQIDARSVIGDAALDYASARHDDRDPIQAARVLLIDIEAAACPSRPAPDASPEART